MTEATEDKDQKPASEGPRRRWIAWLTFILLLLAIILVHRCYQEPKPPEIPQFSTGPAPYPLPVDTQPEPDTLPPEPELEPELPPPPPKPVPKPKPDTVPTKELPAESLFVYADPWGGRHFDSVTVQLICPDSCLILFSTKDSVHLQTYDGPLTFRRNTTLWFTGLDGDGAQVPIQEVSYVIEKDPGACPENMMPFSINEATHCMDQYEWPNLEGEIPKSFVSREEAADSCGTRSKRLCTEAEWRKVCVGPENLPYPYGKRYNEKACATQQRETTRSGRLPMCRSYYGIHDMTGNLWEWTSTEASQPGRFMVVGGNWSTGSQADCSLSKFSFYPQNSYPIVGFRCCLTPGE